MTDEELAAIEAQVSQYDPAGHVVTRLLAEVRRLQREVAKNRRLEATQGVLLERLATIRRVAATYSDDDGEDG